MKTSRLLLVVLLISVAGCASGPRIRIDADPAVNIPGTYGTYAFFEPLATDEAGYSTLLTARLKDAITRELNARGYTLSKENPELLVNFNVNVVEKTEVYSSPSASFGYGYYGYRYGMYGAWSGYPYDVRTTNYRQGTLVIDVVDSSRKVLVWQGVAEGRISRKAMDNPADAVNMTVSKIMEAFPGRTAVASAQ